MSEQRLTPVSELIAYIRQNIGQVPLRHEEKFKELLELEEEELTHAYLTGKIKKGDCDIWYKETYKTDNNGK